MGFVTEDGKELTLNIFKPGSYFPMVWVMGDSPNKYEFQTLTKVELIRTSKESFLSFIEKDPEILMDLTRRILTGVDGLLTNIQYIFFGNSYHRVLSVLVICARRFGEKKIGLL